MTIRVLVVDDEPPARRKLLTHLKHEPEVEIAGEAGDGLEAVESIRHLTPDLVFLDVQMPGLNGFEVLEVVGSQAMPLVVFVTAYDDFALDAFAVEAVDYLLKPFDGGRFRKAFERARRRLAERSGEGERLERLLQAVLPQGERLQRLVVRKGERIFLVPVAEVIRLAAAGNYVEVHTEKGTFLLRETMASLERRLDPERFARIHRSEIVNVDAIRELQPFFHGDYIVVLANGERRRLSRRFQDRLLK